MVVAAPIGSVTTELASNTHVKLNDNGTGFLFNLSGATVPLSAEALDRLTTTLLARKAAKEHG